MANVDNGIEVQIRATAAENECGQTLYLTKFYVWKDAQIVGSQTVASDEPFVIATCFLKNRIKQVKGFVEAATGKKIEVRLCKPDFGEGHDTDYNITDWMNTVAEIVEQGVAS